jgi:hypothetical protein
MKWQDWTPTPVFDSFWRFAAERHAIYLQRVAGEPPPWTNDPILRCYRFTNVYRAADRVSQQLISQVQYDAVGRSAVDVALRTLLFKVFNRSSTWRLLLETTGDVTADSFNVTAYTDVLDAAMAAGEKVYSAAYIIPPVPASGSGRKHAGHLQLLDRMLRSGGIDRLTRAPSLAAVYEQLRRWPGFGPFLAYQLTIDLNYSTAIDFDENEFVVAGPGALDGISKCFATASRTRPEAVIHAVWRAQQDAFAERGLDFAGLWGRPMSLIDVQNVFCEISKYARVAHPDVPGRAGRLRIKQRFQPIGPLPPPVFPPKWQLAVAA